MSVNWSYYEKFESLNDKYLPSRGDGTNMATQAVTAINKLVYKWYNDGDVYDNTHYLTGWCNDISGSANWLAKYIPETEVILNRVWNIYSESEYEDILKEVANIVFDEQLLSKLETQEKQGDAYGEDGNFEFVQYDEDEDEEYWEEDEEYY